MSVRYCLPQGLWIILAWVIQGMKIHARFGGGFVTCGKRQRAQKMLEGHLSHISSSAQRIRRVIYLQVYNVYEDEAHNLRHERCGAQLQRRQRVCHLLFY